MNITEKKASRGLIAVILPIYCNASEPIMPSTLRSSERETAPLIIGFANASLKIPREIIVETKPAAESPITTLRFLEKITKPIITRPSTSAKARNPAAINAGLKCS